MIIIVWLCYRDRDAPATRYVRHATKVHLPGLLQPSGRRPPESQWMRVWKQCRFHQRHVGLGVHQKHEYSGIDCHKRMRTARPAETSVVLTVPSGIEGEPRFLHTLMIRRKVHIVAKLKCFSIHNPRFSYACIWFNISSYQRINLYGFLIASYPVQDTDSMRWRRAFMQ